MIKNSNTFINLLGQAVKQVRTQKGWSQEEFAGMSGVSPRTLQRIEAGEKANAETLRAIATVLNMDVTELLPLNILVQDEEFTKVQAQLQVQQKEEAAQLEKELNVLPHVNSGKDLLDALTGIDALNTDYPHPNSEEEGAAVGSLLEIVRDFGDMQNDLGPQQMIKMMFDAGRCIEDLENFGLLVFAGKLRGSIVAPAPRGIERPPIYLRQGGVFICRATEVKTFKDPNNQEREAYRFRIPYGRISF